MSAAARLPAILASISTATALTALLLTPRQHLPTSLTNYLPANFRTHVLRLLGAIFLLLNIKNIPTSWHIRVLRAIQYQIYASPLALSGRDLFRPLVTTTRNSLLDCDYNLHKSNSTYFKDLDVSRAHFVGALLRTGLRRLNSGDTDGLGIDGKADPLAAAKKSVGAVDSATSVAASSGTAASTSAAGARSQSKVPDRWIIALGGVACVFRKEIKPLAKFEVWTRLLSWDDKWIYVVSHVVKAGAVKHKGYALQPWKKQGQGRWWWTLFGSKDQKKAAATTRGSDGSERNDLRDKAEGAERALDEELRRAVYATSIAKYVCKKGRLTVAPEVVLKRSRLLPNGPKPPGLSKDSSSASASTTLLPSGETSDISVRSEADLLLLSRRGLAGASSASGTDTPVSTAGLEGPESSSLSSLAAAPGSDSAVSEQQSEEEADVLPWEVIEKLRVAGLKYAQQMDGLTGLHDEFGRNEGPELESGPGAREVLGVYSDFIY